MSGAAIPSALAYVTFQSRTATTPTEHTAAWPDLAEQLTCHTRRLGKDGPAWSPAVYKRGKDGKLLTRANDAVQSLTCAVADVDHVELDDVVALRDHVRSQGLACAVYSTHSSTETEPRVRVVVPFAKPVPAETWPRLWPALNERIFLGLADPAASDPARLYYLPSAPEGVATISERWDGMALDWHGLPLADPRPAAAPATTSGAGPSETVDPEDMPVLEKLFSGRLGERRLRVWMGDYSDFGGDPSRGDQSLANGIVTYCQGDVKRAERIMRGGPWRPKWDDPRGATTVLGLALGKALAAFQAYRERYPDFHVDELGGQAEEPPADETLEQKVARLEQQVQRQERGLANARAVNAQQQTIIRAQRERLAVLEPIVTQIDEILARPEQETDEDGNVIRGGLSSDDKVVDIALARWLPAYNARKEANGERPTVSLGYLSKVIGMPKRRISNSLARQAGKQEDGAAFGKHIERKPMVDDNGKPVLDENGEQRWESSLEVWTWGETPAATLRAAATYATPVRPKRGGSKAASDARWGRCDKHQNREVKVKGYCPDCGTVVGERTMKLDEFDALNVQTGHSEERAPSSPPVEGTYLTDVQDGHSDAASEAVRPLNLQPVHSDPPVSLPAYAATRSQPGAEVDGSRCVRSGCTRPPASGRLVCGPCYAEPVPAVAGGAE